MEKPVKVVKDTTVQIANKLIAKLSIRFTIGDKLNQKKFGRCCKPPIEGSSLRGVSRTTNLAYNTVVSLIRAASVKGQMVHNEEVQQIKTEQVAGDEFWSFVQKNKNTANPMN
jgi:hypothetical protein